VTWLDAATAKVLIEKLAVVAPEATVIDGGIVALALLELKLMVVPPDGAAPLRVTVPADAVPPITVVGATVRLTNAGGLIVRVAVFIEEPRVPVMDAATELATADVDTVNVAEVVPAPMVTEEGSVALELLDDRLTTIPLEPAGAFMVAVPTDETPPVTIAGETVRLTRAGGLMVSVADLEDVPTLPVIVAETELDVTAVEIKNVVEFVPTATVTLVGSVALVLLEVSPTIEPLGPAGPFNVTVPVEEDPPMTDDGDTVRLLNPGGVIDKIVV